MKLNTELPVTEQAVIAVPEIMFYSISNGSSSSSSSSGGGDGFIVLGCDGIYDVLSNYDIVNYVGKKIEYYIGTSGSSSCSSGGGSSSGSSGLDLLKTAVVLSCDDLLEYCIESGSNDNMSVIVIIINPDLFLNAYGYSGSSSGNSSGSGGGCHSNTTTGSPLQIRAIKTPSSRDLGLPPSELSTGTEKKLSRSNNNSGDSGGDDGGSGSDEESPVKAKNLFGAPTNSWGGWMG